MATATLDRRQGAGTKIIVTIAILAFAGALLLMASLALFTDQATTTATPSAPATSTSPHHRDRSRDDARDGPGRSGDRTADDRQQRLAELRYAATSTTTENVLAAELVLTIKSG